MPTGVTTRFVAILLAVLCASSLGCGSATAPDDDFADDRRSTLAAFRSARQKWAGARLLDYRYTYRKLCFCAPPVRAPVRIRVRGGRVVEVSLVETGTAVPIQGYPSVDALFDLIQAALDGRAAEIRAQYDGRWGYPTDLYIDRDRGIADEELRIEASALEPLA